MRVHGYCMDDGRHVIPPLSGPAATTAPYPNEAASRCSASGSRCEGRSVSGLIEYATRSPFAVGRPPTNRRGLCMRAVWQASTFLLVPATPLPASGRVR